jgi:predicted N-formylglutamate amidohydrolase
MCVLISCEVAGDQVPSWMVSPKESKKSRSPDDQPDTDALYIARRMAQRLDAPLVIYPWVPDLIRVEKSIGNRLLFARRARNASAEVRERLIQELYLPYHQDLKKRLAGVARRESFVIHLSIQSFPGLGPKNQVRRSDVGLVYDPANTDQSDLALDWIDEMYESAPMLKVRRNTPRPGTTDSIVRSMNKEFDRDTYVGLELFANRSWASRNVKLRDEAIDAMANALKLTLEFPISEAA